jgi:hypothetical protein
MKKLASLTAAVVVLATAGSVHAQSQETLEIQARKVSVLEAKEAYQEYKGTYEMSDGSLFSFRKMGSRYYAVIDSTAPAELKYVGDNRFVTASGRTEFQFATNLRLHATVVMSKENGVQVASTTSAKATL